MAVIRAFGLIFFLMILVGGCIIANSPSQQIELAAAESVEISWDAAIDYVQGGEVQTITQDDGYVVMVLLDGSVVTVMLPFDDILVEEDNRCGPLCESIWEMGSKDL
jgi:hypothetical protein